MSRTHYAYIAQKLISKYGVLPEAMIKFKCPLDEACRQDDRNSDIVKGYMFEEEEYIASDVCRIAKYTPMDLLGHALKHVNSHDNSDQKGKLLKSLREMEKKYDAEKEMDDVPNAVKELYSGEINVGLRELHACVLGMSSQLLCTLLPPHILRRAYKLRSVNSSARITSLMNAPRIHSSALRHRRAQ